MKKEELKENVRGYAQKFEDGGLRLLKKGQKGIVHAIFSRFGLVLVLLLLQVGLLFSIFRWFGNLLPHYFGGSVVVTAAMVVYLLNSKMDNSAKITWMVVVAILPVVGVPLFFYVKSNAGHNLLRKRLMELENTLRPQLPQNREVVERLRRAEPGAASLAKYLHGPGGGFPVYENTAMTYFPSGEAKFAELLRQLDTAEKYIFVEYFIIDEGLFWGRVLEILARKAAEGVDVRVMYDGTCEFSTLPRDYPKRLEALGIQCKVFSPVQPFVSTHYNYRDHRKILVIDGRVGFTGGVNLADEYINHVEKYGRWKDAAIMLEGEAVRSLTALFLEMWSVLKEPEFEAFLADPIPVPEHTQGTAAPYGDCPLDGERVGEMVYIDLLNRAREYIHIMTPYLILDGELETALKFAAERGVDVHLILPGIADKKFPNALAKTHYSALLDSGVKISEWMPGFVHAKVFVVDDREAVVGTINLDYRSLYHHFENAVWLTNAPCIRDIEEDFQATLEQCRTVENNPKSIWQGRFLFRAVGMLLKVIAPLL
ncbi:phospholipase D-like domain-containing protein [Faecalibacterium hattorii]|uniref:phospholipase D-like domain-containing protein n=1 Tax=Faecalibacterium hattorii TaxID=2935520 RepID=UPI003AAB6E01